MPLPSASPFESSPDLDAQSTHFPDDERERFRLRRDRFLSTLSPIERERLAVWLSLGRKNPWISESYDPPFNELSFEFCSSARRLVERLLHGNWCLGQAFSFENICFINQIDGGDEWLTIKDDLAFESITFDYDRNWHSPEKPKLRKKLVQRTLGTIASIQAASLEQCRRLEYAEPYVVTQEFGLEPALLGVTGGASVSSDARLRSCFSYSYRDRYTERCPQVLVEVMVEACRSSLRFVVKNGRTRYLVSTDSAGSAVVEMVAGKTSVQRWRIPAEKIAVVVGGEGDSTALEPLAFFALLLPVLRYPSPWYEVSAPMARSDGGVGGR